MYLKHPASAAGTPGVPTANIVRRDGAYHLLMLVEGEWLDTGLSAPRLLDLTMIADQQFAKVLINAPLHLPPQSKAA